MADHAIARMQMLHAVAPDKPWLVRPDPGEPARPLRTGDSVEQGGFANDDPSATAIPGAAILQRGRETKRRRDLDRARATHYPGRCRGDFQIWFPQCLARAMERTGAAS